MTARRPAPPPRSAALPLTAPCAPLKLSPPRKPPAECPPRGPVTGKPVWRKIKMQFGIHSLLFKETFVEKDLPVLDKCREMGFDAVEIIPFDIEMERIAKLTAIWRKLAESPEELASQGLQFLKNVYRDVHGGS